MVVASITLPHIQQINVQRLDQSLYIYITQHLLCWGGTSKDYNYSQFLQCGYIKKGVS